MIALDLIAAHLFGDYVFQFGRIPAEKLSNWHIRLLHVAVYSACFVIPAVAVSRNPARVCVFLSALAACHFVTDSRRYGSGQSWAPRPIMVDQSLHLMQLAVLSRVLTGSVYGYPLAAALFALMLALYAVYGAYERRLSRKEPERAV